MRTARYLWFFLMIALGVIAGLFLAWAVFPVQYTNTPPATLRIDYKTDYVLMVAEIYDAHPDLAAANQQLQFLGNQTPIQIAQNAILTARQLNYTSHDLQLIIHLSEALVKATPTPEGVSP
jgi:hypothetical protein